MYLFDLACSRLSVSGGMKKRAGDEWGLVGKKERSGTLLFSPGSRSPLIPLFARSLFRSSSLTESLEQASLITRLDQKCCCTRINVATKSNKVR